MCRWDSECAVCEVAWATTCGSWWGGVPWQLVGAVKGRGAYACSGPRLQCCAGIHGVYNNLVSDNLAQDFRELKHCIMFHSFLWRRVWLTICIYSSNYEALFTIEINMIVRFQKSVGGGWTHNLFIYMFICWSNSMAALLLCYQFTVYTPLKVISVFVLLAIFGDSF